MQQTISPRSFENILTSPSYTEKKSRASRLKKFFEWCDQQEKNRLLWVGIAIMGHIGMIVPLTLLAILFLADNNFTLWVIALCANVPVLALNLAAQPPKVTIPVMVTALLVNAGIIVASAIMFFM